MVSAFSPVFGEQVEQKKKKYVYVEGDHTLAGVVGEISFLGEHSQGAVGLEVCLLYL